MSDLPLEDIAAELTDSAHERFEQLGFTDPDLGDCFAVVEQFNQIAANMLQEEEGIQAPGNRTAIPYDEQTARQLLTLINEGIVHALIKCDEMGVNTESRLAVMQQAALEIYNQSKQVVASTYGQESTPDLQISMKQQIMMMQQGAENNLLYFLNEYEKHHPVEAEMPKAVELPPSAEPLPEPVPEKPAPPPPKAQQVAPETNTWDEEGWEDDEDDGWGDEDLLKTQKPKRPAAVTPATNEPSLPAVQAPHEKFAAVALLLSTLPQGRHEGILQHFNPDEQMLIAHYGNPDNLAEGLDLVLVNQQLKQFRELLKEQGPAIKSKAYRGIQQLTQAFPESKVLSLLKKDRPLVLEYVQGFYGAADRPTTANAGLLPPRLEEVIGQYLSSRLGKAS